MGEAIVGMLMAGAVGFMMHSMALASNQKPMADMVKVVAVLVCISIGAEAVWQWIESVAESFQVFQERLDGFTSVLRIFRRGE